MRIDIVFIACDGKDGARSEKEYPAVSRVYTSAYECCRATAWAVYPKIPALPANGIRDFDFGDLNGKNREELVTSEIFEKWAKSEKIIPFPGGEAPHSAAAFNLKEFANILDDLEHSNVSSAALVAPKGAIFVVLNRYLLWGEGYLGMNVSDGGGCVAAYDTDMGSMRLTKIF